MSSKVITVHKLPRDFDELSIDAWVRFLFFVELLFALAPTDSLFTNRN
jgi:hypothetical protein